jgi:hypothetical protein
VSYDEDYTVVVNLAKKSSSTSVDIVVAIETEEFGQEWEIEKIEQDNEISFQFNSLDLHSGENAFNINVTYHDDYSNEYFESDYFTISLEGLSFWQKFKLFFRNLL